MTRTTGPNTSGVSRAWAQVTCAARHWSSDRASTTGATLAFYCAFSLAPLLVILLTLAGWIVGTETAYGQVGSQLNALFGPATAETVLSAVKRSQQVQGLVSIIGVLDFFAALALVSLLFALIYRYMPARRSPWKVVLIGGVLTALLFNFGRWAISLYLAHSTQPSAFGAAASFAALLLWLYYSAQIFLFGAELTACLAGIRDSDEALDVGASKTGESGRRS